METERREQVMTRRALRAARESAAAATSQTDAPPSAFGSTAVPQPTLTRRELRAMRAQEAAENAPAIPAAPAPAVAEAPAPFAPAVAAPATPVLAVPAAPAPTHLDEDAVGLAQIADTLNSLEFAIAPSHEVLAEEMAASSATSRQDAPATGASVDAPAVKLTIPEPATRHLTRREARAEGARTGASTKAAVTAQVQTTSAVAKQGTAGRGKVPHPVQWVPRLAVLGVLGAVSVAIPTKVWADSSSQDIAQPPQVADDSALDTLVATEPAVAAAVAEASDQEGVAAAAVRSATGAAEGDDTGESEGAEGSESSESAESLDSTASSLLASDPLAASRSSVASRSEERQELPSCDAPETSTANGSLAALETSEYVQLVYPVQDGVYTKSSDFGPRWGTVHYGTDLSAPLGTEIRAVASGVVTNAGGSLGGRSPNLIAVRSEINGQQVEIWYNHMYDNGVLVSVGDEVTVGDTIGLVGSNGYSTGPHLHLEVHVGDVSDYNGSAVDPWAWLAANGAQPITTSGPVCQ